MSRRTFLHVDMDAFFAAVEQHDHPELRGKPVVVGAPPDRRGVVSTASYEARPYGIHSAMPSREAFRRCPHAVFLPVNGKRYRDVSQQIFALFERFTPYVEGLSIDEAFLDVTGSEHLFGPGPEIARRIKQAVREETGLTASVGVAINKFLAKLASDLEKPDGLTVMPEAQAEIAAFLAPLPVSRIWGVGKVTQQHLAAFGVHTIGDLQQTPERVLQTHVGRHAARHLLRLAFGEDSREIELEREEKSISHEHTFIHDCDQPEEVRRVLGTLVDDVGRRLRAADRFARVAHLKLRWKGFQTLTRQRQFREPCCDDFALRELACAMLDEEPLIKPVRLVGFGVSHFVGRPQRQLSLFDDAAGRAAKHETLSRTVDRIRERHGRGSIARGSA